MTKIDNTEKYLTRRQLANRWTVCTRTVRRCESQGLRVTRIKGNVRYALTDVVCFEEDGRR